MVQNRGARSGVERLTYIAAVAATTVLAGPAVRGVLDDSGQIVCGLRYGRGWRDRGGFGAHVDFGEQVDELSVGEGADHWSGGLAHLRGEFSDAGDAHGWSWRRNVH
ncbi:MAG: hypothetical protein JO022_08815 [Acidobacteriaceae bacterium]|nr:hypothetical protein [Acidobacteriaceae bacterium]